ncbi:MAG: pentapeptide repeat-containing protein [Planctomycetota bacterium]
MIKSTLGLVPAFLDRQAKSEAVARGEQQELRELASRLQRIDEVDDVALGRLRELAGAHPQSRAEATGRLAGFARRVSDRAAALAPDDADLERLHDLVEAAVKCASELRRDELGFDFEQRRLRLVVPEAPDLAARIENRELTSAIELDLAAVRLPRADLSKAYLPGAELSGADLRDANLYALRAAGAKFSHADLRGAKIRHADLRAVVARGADFSFLAGATGGVGVDVCSLSKTTLEGATLDGSSFVGAQLFQTDLRNASLRDVDFSFANLTQTKFGEQPLHRVHLWGADLSLAEGLRPEDLHEVCFNEETRWPPGCPAPTSRWECGADHRGF